MDDLLQFLNADTNIKNNIVITNQILAYQIKETKNIDFQLRKLLNVNTDRNYNLIRIIMKVIGKISRSTNYAPLNQNLRFQFSLLKKQTQQELINNPIFTFGKLLNPMKPMYYHRQIMNSQNFKYLSLYINFLLPRYSFVGVNRKTNYHLYLKTLQLSLDDLRRAKQQPIISPQINSQEQNKAKETLKEQKFKFQPNVFTKTWANPDKPHTKWLPFIAIALYLSLYLSGIFDEIEERNQLNQQLDLQKRIDFLFEDLRQVHVKKIESNVPYYYLDFRYDNNRHVKYRFSGNLNHFLSLLEHHQIGKLQKVKLLYAHKNYTIFHSFYDVIRLTFPFIGIAISFYIFRKFSPDSLLSKLSPKKSFKIEGTRDIKVKFADVAGMQQAKRQITEFVDFLKHGEKYKEMGAKIPKGALLTGPPGTGKTMLAKACAGEAGVTFFYISGSEFVQMFVGLGASKVRELFSLARMQAPSIIFIDQIDAIGKKRQNSRNQEKDSTLNQLLVQMDGFSSHQTVIVLAATNRKDTLDSALTRPGRFDRMVEVTLPDLKARQEIYKVHLKNLKIDPSRKLQDVAKRLSQLSPGFSGADIANLCNQAAIIATRKKKTYIEDKDFEDASERITAGYEKKDLLNPKTKKRVAYHEAGHAICGWFLKGGDPLVKLTIIPRSKGALGYAQYLPKSSYIKTKEELIDQIAIMMGGFTSEQFFMGSCSSGASDDLQKVYSVARKMVASYGMGREIYNVTLDEESFVRKQSQFLSKKMDEQMMIIVDEAKVRAKEIIKKNEKTLKKLAELLIQKQTINSEDIKSILGQRPAFN